MNETTSAEEFRASSRFTHTTHDGKTILYRRIAFLDLVSRGVIPPAILTNPKEIPGEALRFDSPERLVLLYRAVIGAAVMAPPVWEGTEAERPESHVLVDDLLAYADDLVADILEASNFTAQVTRGAAFRRRASGPGADDRAGATQDRPNRSQRRRDVGRRVGVRAGGRQRRGSGA